MPIDANFPRLGPTLRALSHPDRYAIVAFLHQNGRSSVSEITFATQFPQPLVSAYLKALKIAEVLTGERAGSRVYYTLASPWITKLMRLLQQELANPTPATDAG